MNTSSLRLNVHPGSMAVDPSSASAPAPMLGRGWALMTAAGARRTAAELRREAAIVGDSQSPRYRELMSLALAIEQSKG